MEVIQISKEELYQLIKQAIREGLEDLILSLFEKEEISEGEKKGIEKILEENKKGYIVGLKEFLNEF